jgi:hypothetical protein
MRGHIGLNARDRPMLGARCASWRPSKQPKWLATDIASRDRANAMYAKAQDAPDRIKLIARTAQSATPFWNQWRSETYAKDKY